MSTLTPVAEASPLATNDRSIPRLVLGSFTVLIALAFLSCAVAGIFGLENNRDASGYFVTHTHHYQTSSYALSTESLNVGGVTGALESGLLRLRLTATSADAAKPLFIGIARTADAQSYLAGVAHDELRDISFDPFKIHYQPSGFGAPQAVPAAQTFWQTQAVGRGTQTITWPVRGGQWTAVVMNADGSRNVGVDAQVAARLSGAWWWVVGMLTLGALALAGGIVLIRSGARRPEPATTGKEV